MQIMEAPTNHLKKKTKCSKNEIEHGDLLTNEENLAREMPHLVILRSPFPRIH